MRFYQALVIIIFRGFILKVSRFYFSSRVNFGLPGGQNATSSADRGLCQRERWGVQNHVKMSESPESTRADGWQQGLMRGVAGGTCPLCCRRCPFRAREAPAQYPLMTLGKCLGEGSTCSCPWGWRSRERQNVKVRNSRCKKKSGPCSPASGTNVSEAIPHIYLIVNHMEDVFGH